MSRVANNPVKLPSGVEITLNGQALKVKGSKGSLDLDVAFQHRCKAGRWSAAI